MPGRYIAESVRLISDNLEYTDEHSLPGFLVTADTEKAFDSIEHPFIVATFKKLGFGPTFINWVKVLLFKQESCVVNNGHSTCYFKCSRGARQGNPLSAYLFIMALEMLFIQVRNCKEISGNEMFGYKFKLSAFTDDATYFILNEHSIQQLATLFSKFEEYSSLKVNTDKTEVCDIGSKKWVIQALSRFKAVNLVTDSILILGCHYSYKKELVIEKNFKNNLFPKIQYIAQTSLVPKQIIEQLKLMHKNSHGRMIKMIKMLKELNILL